MAWAGRVEGPPLVASIVLAEDDADLRTLYLTLLRGAGYHVLEATQGQEALDLVRQHRPDLLLLDLWMPVLNGFEVLDQLRNDSAAGCTKVVMLSCQSDADSRLECFGVGATDYLVKGLSLAELLEHVRRWLTPAEIAPETT